MSNFQQKKSEYHQKNEKDVLYDSTSFLNSINSKTKESGIPKKVIYGNRIFDRP